MSLEGEKNKGLEPIIPCNERVIEFKERYLSLGRNLEAWEIQALEGLGNRCSDWSKIKVSDDFYPKAYFQNHFVEENYLSSLESEIGFVGVERSTFRNCHIECEVSIKNVNLIENVYISRGVKLWNNGSIIHEGDWSPNFSIYVGSEVKGRELSLYPELIPDQAVLMLRPEGISEDIIKDFSIDFSILSESCCIENVPKVTNVMLGKGTKVSGALELDKVLTLSNLDESVYIGAGASVRQVMMQWSSKIDRNAVAENSFFFEQSSLDQAGVVVESCIGSNTHIGKGEVTASFVGPFVGMHHQSLLIGAIWPEGKGNVGYGANVGSNHTGRAPDQEFWPAEGEFFGLSSSIKFPANHRRAPYTIIATGLILPPQNLSFPFSLVNQAKVTVGENDLQHELIPAWMLLENRYGLVRTAWKVKVRNKSRRYEFENNYLNERSAESTLLALQELESLEVKENYYSGDFNGCRGCFMTRANVVRGISAYQEALELYYLEVLSFKKNIGENEQSLLDRIQMKLSLKEISAEGQKERLYDLKRKEFEVAFDSKDKDRERGTEIIPNYNYYHPDANSDLCLNELKSQLETLKY